MNKLDVATRLTSNKVMCKVAIDQHRHRWQARPNPQFVFIAPWGQTDLFGLSSHLSKEIFSFTKALFTRDIFEQDIAIKRYFCVMELYRPR